MSFLRSYSIGVNNPVTAEDLISTLENLLIQSKDHYDTKSKLPWNYMLLFNVCGKYNFGLLEFLNHPEYFETLKRISTFLENLEDIEPAIIFWTSTSKKAANFLKKKAFLMRLITNPFTMKLQWLPCIFSFWLCSASKVLLIRPFAYCSNQSANDIV